MNGLPCLSTVTVSMTKHSNHNAVKIDCLEVEMLLGKNTSTAKHQRISDLDYLKVEVLLW